MDLVTVWNSLTYFDGILFSIWVGIMYYGKCWMDYKFRKDDE